MARAKNSRKRASRAVFGVAKRSRKTAYKASTRKRQGRKRSVVRTRVAGGAKRVVAKKKRVASRKGAKRTVKTIRKITVRVFSGRKASSARGRKPAKRGRIRPSK